MRKFTITDSEGGRYPGRLPENWGEVPLAKYAALANAPDLPAHARALAELCGLPTDLLNEDVSLMVPITQAVPWLFNGPLPAPIIAAPESFQHQGVTYVPAPADLEKINGGQLEALLNFLREHEGNPMRCAPALLAILYKPAAKKPLLGKAKETVLTADVVEASTRAFASLPMSVAWPLVQDFLRRSAPTALLIQKYFAVRPVVEKMLSALEAPLSTSARPGFCWIIARWATRIWIRRAKTALVTSSLPFASTGLLPPSGSAPQPTAADE